MTITINAQGAERKRLVKTVSDWLGVPAKYCGAPTFNYEVDYFTIDRNGSLSFDDRADSEVIERLLQHIYDEGFDIDQSHSDDDEPCAVCISMPRSLFTDSNLENLKALITAKGGLIKKALGVADLPLEITDTKVCPYGRSGREGHSGAGQSGSGIVGQYPCRMVEGRCELGAGKPPSAGGYKRQPQAAGKSHP